MALDYGSVKDLYDTLYDSGVTTKTLPEWSQDMNELTGSDLYTAGLHDNIIKRASHGIDKLLESTGLPGYGEQLGRTVGGWVGAPEAGAEVGHGLPRATLNFAPLLIPGGGVPAAVAKFGLTGALTGAEAYEKTDSPLSALISAGVATALPGVAGKVSDFAGQAIAKSIGVPSITGPIADLEGNLISKVAERIPRTPLEKLLVRGGGETAGQIGAAGVVGASQPLEQLAQGQEPTSPFTAENLLGLTLGQAPFAAIHLGNRALGYGPKPITADELQKTVALSKARIDLKQAKDAQDGKTDLEKIPLVERPAAEDLTPTQYKTAAETRLLLSQIRSEQLRIKNDKLLTDEQKVEQLNMEADREYKLTQQAEVEVGYDTILGNGQNPEDARQEVIGNQLMVNKLGTWRAIRVADDPFNPEELRGKVISYSTKNEPNPRFGLQSQETGIARYSLPHDQWRTVKTMDEWNARFKKGDNGQPELPTQDDPMTPEELDSYLHDLDHVETQTDLADTSGDLQKAVVDLQNVQHQNDLTTTSDATLKGTTQRLVDKGVDPDKAVKSAVKVEAKRTGRKITSKQQGVLLQAGYDQATIDSMDVEQRADALAAVKTLKTQKKLAKETPVLMEGDQPLYGEHKSETPFDLSKYDLSRHGEHGATDFGPGIYLDTGAGWDDYGPITQGTHVSAKARVLDLSDKDYTLEEIADKFEKGPYDVLIHRSSLEDEPYISQVVVKDPKFLVKVDETTKSQRAKEREAPLPTKEEYGEIAAKFEGAGFSVIDASKLTHREEGDEPVQEVKDHVTDTAMTTYASDRAQLAFNRWEGKEDTTYDKDFQDFVDLIENYGSLKNVPLKEAGQMLAERTGAVPWDEAEVKEFISRPHVQEWSRELDRGLGDQQVVHATPPKGVPSPIPIDPQVVQPTIDKLGENRVKYGTTDELLGTRLPTFTFDDPNLVRARDITGGNRNFTTPGGELGLFYTQSKDVADMYQKGYGPEAKRELAEHTLNPQAKGFLTAEPTDELVVKLGLMSKEEVKKIVDGDNPQDLYPVADKRLAQYFRDRGFDYYTRDDGNMGADPEFVVLTENAIQGGAQVLTAPIPAGGKFVYSLNDYDPATRTLGKHTLPKDGKVVTEAFRNMAGLGKPLQKAEVEFYKQIVPEAFEGAFVDVPKLYEGLRTKGPQVETKELKDQTVDELTRRQAELEHQLETFGYEIETSYDADETYLKKKGSEFGDIIEFDSPEYEKVPQYIRTIFEEYGQNRYNMSEEPETAGIGKYADIGPKNAKDMPGYVEGLVRLPHTKPLNPPKTEESLRQKGILYSGPHFGAEDQNVLAFYRGYEETLPNGEKAFHVIEVQSDWAQRQQAEVKQVKQARKDLETHVHETMTPGTWHYVGDDNYQGGGMGLVEAKTKAEAVEQYLGKLKNLSRRIVPDQPLLPLYETLALKAAIQHAKEVGATKVILSDAETAMMTEGHDRARQFRPADELTYDKKFSKDQAREAQLYAGDNGAVRQLSDGSWGAVKDKATLGDEPILTQEKGMRLHYNQSMPSILEKLTGEKGENVDLGVHKMADTEGAMRPENGPEFLQLIDDRNAGRITNEQYLQRTQELRNELAPKATGSPVFKDQAGNPKTQITGRSYDISKVPDQFTLTEANRVPQGGKLNADAPLWTPEDPRDIETIQRMGLAQGGKGMLNFLLNGTYFKGLAKDLSKFGDSLDRTDASVRQLDGGAFATTRPNGRMEVSLSPAILRSSPWDQEYTVAHELVHSLSMHELYNPTNRPIYNALTALKDKVTSRLPASLRKPLDDAIQRDWYQNWHDGKETFEQLAPNATSAERALLYGLISTHEFVSQGFTSPGFRAYLQSIKTSEGGSWFSRFSGFVKDLLKVGEKVDNNAFEEFLSKTDQLLQQGEYVSSFRNFSDRYFENLGMSKGFVDANTQRAMGVLLNDAKLRAQTPEELLGLVRNGAGIVRSPDWARTQRDVIRMFNDKGEDALNTQSVLDEMGHKPDQNGLIDYAHSLMVGEGDSKGLDLLPESAARYVFENAKDAQNILGAIHDATLEKNKGVFNLANPKLVHGLVKETLKGVDSVLEQNRLHDMQIRDMQDMLSIPPDGYFKKVLTAPATVPEWASGEPKRTWLDVVTRFLEPVGQLARRAGPAAAEAFSRGWQLTANQRKMLSESMKAFGMDLSTMQLTKETVKNFARAISQPHLVIAANKWIYENQVAGKRTGETRVIDADDPRIVNIIGNMSPKDRDIVEDIVNKHSISMQHMQEQILEKGLQIASTNGAVIAQNATGGKLTDALLLSDTLLRAFTTDRSDPNAAATADAQIQSVQNRMSLEGFQELAKFASNAAEIWKTQREWFKTNPAWSTAQRYGKFIVEYRKGGKTFTDGVDSKKEAVALAGGRPYKLTKNNKYDEDRPPVLGVDAPGVVNKLRELEQNQYDILRNRGFTAEDIESMKQTSPAEQFATEETYRGGVPGLTPPPRGLTKGAEELPWLRNHFSWVSKTSNYWSRQLLRAQARAHLLDPEISQNEQLSRDLRTHYDNMLQPDSQVGRLAQRSAMAWFMGFNPASALINGTQPFLTHVAELTAMSGKPLDSYRRVLSALKDVYATGLGKLEWKDPEIAKLMHEATAAGERDLHMFDDSAAEQESIHTNYKRILAGNREQTLGQRLAGVAGNFSNASMLLFRTVERINNDAALIASYKYYKESQPNLSPNELIAKAFEFNHAVNYGGGRAQRPIGAFSGRGAFPRTVAMLATAMQSYNLGTTFQIARYIRSGFFRPEGLTPAEIHSARTAVVQMLGTQLVAAGAIGLPFVSGMLSVLNQAFPGLEINRKLRETMNSVLGGDSDNGHILSDIAMTGAPSMLGWDLQSRLSMGNTLPGVSEINGFEPENLLGAPANLVANFVKGGQKLAAGDIHGVDNLVPSGIKKLEQLLRSGGQVLDYRNRPIFTPTLGEKVGIALGFQPKRLSDFNVASRIAKQADDNVKSREAQFHQQMAGEVLKGNFGTVRQSLLQRSRDDKTYDPVAAVRSISGTAEELTFPRDLRREGTLQSGDVRAKLLSTFNLPQVQPSETDRLRFRQGVQQRLGLVSTSPTDLQTAQVVDSLRSKNPTASRSELRQQATLLLHGRRLGKLSLLAE